MIETATFVCSICGESSTDICVYCTKDTCRNHRCVRCLRCSDCCECEVPLTAGSPEDERHFYPPVYAEPVPEPVPQPPVQTEPSVPAPAPAEAEPEAIVYVEFAPEISGVAAIIAPQPPEPVPPVAEPVEKEMTREELVRSLPELFAPEREPAKPEAPETSQSHPPASEPESDDKK